MGAENVRDTLEAMGPDAIDALRAYGRVRRSDPRVVTFTVDGDPVPKGRPRHALNGHTYTPPRTVEYEERIGFAWIGEGPKPPPFIGPVSVTIIVRERVHPADLDNYAKVVLDGLNGLAWADDKQVESLHASIERRWPRPGITVAVMELP